jgi:hypothetical protein
MAMRLPDFLVIGAMKCATSSLHAQLAAQPGIAMSAPKEPNFFGDDETYARGISWYSSLFPTDNGTLLVGESSTQYTKFPTYPSAAQRIQRILPDARLVYVIRHPVERLVSHYIHDWTMRKINCPLDEAIDRYPALVDCGKYAMQLSQYLAYFDSDQILVVFFERLTSYPHEEFDRICRFLGYPGKAAWNDNDAEHNVSTQRLRASPVRDLLVDAPLLRAIRRQLVPRAIRSAVKRLWSMKRRPQPTTERLDQLHQVFDSDLAVLGRWLGIEISCRNFSEIARTHEPRWSKPAI